MAWTVGHEELYIGDHVIECVWEVDESSEVDADKSDKIPYLLVPRIEDADVPYPDIEWVASNELAGQTSVVDMLHDDYDPDYPPVFLLSIEQTRELAHAMDRISENVSMSDFR